MKIIKTLFDKMPDGKPVFRYTLSNETISASVLNYGGILQSLVVDGKDIVCGYDNITAYLENDGYHGALIGRYANRICEGRFTLDGVEYTLAKNEKGITHLHGGDVGFDKKFWNVKDAKADEKKVTLALEFFSPDMEEGYPGNLNVRVTYHLSGRDFSIRYEATSDKNTVLNLTNHSYFNMNGFDGGSVEEQTLGIFADTYTEVDGTLIPVKDSPVEGTPFDFRTPKKVGADIGAEDVQLRLGGGYDHNFNLSGDEFTTYMGKKLRYGCIFSGDVTMKVYTDKPAVQFYAGNFMGGGHPFKNGVERQKRHGLALETQFRPDSPNHDGARLDAGKKYDYTTLFRFEE